MRMGLSPYYPTIMALLLALPTCSLSQDASASASASAFVCSRATFYGSPDCLGTPSGACGFGEFGRRINGGDVGGVAKLYKNGTGCGACYQVRCTQPQVCNPYGLTIVVTDYGEGDHTDFILSTSAYSKLALPNMALELMAYGVVDIEYRRVSCQYPGYNMMFKVHENSRYPDSLALVIWYQAGQYDITAVELWQEDCKEWRGMRRAYGAVWDMPNPPNAGAGLNLRFRVSGGVEGEKWVVLPNAIPTNWKAGAVYDSTIQLS
ncbi:expansin-like B1 [Amborella trichopoda]|nr:expansin-like B1 [Amborella trichopoda]|eukprot:XP_006838532.2 expansin-like B1 [Amborella trichopoda]